MIYPEFIPEDKFLNLHKGLSERDLLKQFSMNLKKIHLLTTSQYSNFNQLISEYIRAGLEIFEMEIGIVSEIQGTDYLISDAISPDNSLSKGDVFELPGTYCNEVFKTGKVIGLPHVGSIDEMRDHPVYQNMKLESYISAPIYIDNIIFGTLNFSSTQIREFGFSEYERELISMMANSIASFLKLREKENLLQKSYTRVRKLTGYVAHDLRTPLGNITSFVELLADADEDERELYLQQIKEMAERGMEIVHTILEAATLSEGVVNTDFRELDLKSLIQQILKEYNSKINSNNLRLKMNLDSAHVLVDQKRILQVFSNLISNAIKYSDPNEMVDVCLKRSNNKAYFSISNKINHQKIIKRGEDLSEEGSVGFGLEIVNEVLKLHKTTLLIEKDENTYKASFTLDLIS